MANKLKKFSAGDLLPWLDDVLTQQVPPVNYTDEVSPDLLTQRSAVAPPVGWAAAGTPFDSAGSGQLLPSPQAQQWQMEQMRSPTPLPAPATGAPGPMFPSMEVRQRVGANEQTATALGPYEGYTFDEVSGLWSNANGEQVGDPPPAVQEALMARMTSQGPQPGDAEYQPELAQDGIVRPASDLPPPNADGRMPQVDTALPGGSYEDANQAYAPDSKASESSLDLESPSWGRFMSSPGSSDALIAFGAGLLGGDSFNDGLAKGAMGFSNAFKPYERMNDAEKERLLYKAKLQAAVSRAGAKGTKVYSDFKTGYDLNGKVIQTRANGYSGEREYNVNGAWTTDMPEGFVPREDSTVGAENKAIATDRADRLNTFLELSGKASTNGSRYTNALSLVDRAGVGRDWLTKGARFIAEGLNANVLGIDPESADEYRIAVRKMELDAAQALKGQGKVTEFERKILQQSIAGLDTNPDAAKKWLKAMAAYESRQGQKLAAWRKFKAEGKGNFDDFLDEWQAHIDATVPNYLEEDTSTSTPSSEVRSKADEILKK